MTSTARPLHDPSRLCALGCAMAISLLVATGCKGEGEDTRECNVHADCASAVCRPDGTCEPITIDDAGQETSLDTGPDETDAHEVTDTPEELPPSDGDSPGCKPNGDGTITAAEMPLGPGFNAMFRVSKGVSGFSSEPDCSSGTCLWDLLDLGGVTTDEPSATFALDQKWFAGIKGFENATYTSRLTDFKLTFGGLSVCDQVQYGVFEVNPSGLFMLGIVSEYAADGTALVYDKPVPLIVFPFHVGTSWTIDTVARGKLCNSIFDYAISQTYTSTVDKLGNVKTPYGTFESVLRINTLMERHLGVGVTATKAVTHTYVTECFGTIAVAVSNEGVSSPEFSGASEVRRLANLP
ncbi:MAG: hypothetical protein BWY17_04835 [Deltaproteobacteria bacterium ADurb.Bin207]|nr:MAG: hypothetical protein BWY17_04835 [Deltaproteobacteria bacterium ADurb.Bin207]